jgi:hypothetical protein
VLIGRNHVEPCIAPRDVKDMLLPHTHIWSVHHIVEIAKAISDMVLVLRKRFVGPESGKKAASWDQRGPRQTSRVGSTRASLSFLHSHLTHLTPLSSLRCDHCSLGSFFASNGSSQSHPQHLFPKHQSPNKQLHKSVEHSPILSRGAVAVRSTLPAVPARFSLTKSQRRPSVLPSRPSRFFSF